MWMWVQFYCGPELDDYHITLLKTLLDGHSLEWFIDNIETEDEDMEVDFTTMVCTLHHRSSLSPWLSRHLGTLMPSVIILMRVCSNYSISTVLATSPLHAPFFFSEPFIKIFA
jgi:hypothetical protein